MAFWTRSHLPRAVAGIGSMQCTCANDGETLPPPAPSTLTKVSFSDDNTNCGWVTSLQTSPCIGMCPCCVMASFQTFLLKTGLLEPIRMALRASNPLLHPTNRARNVDSDAEFAFAEECSFV